MSIYKLPAPESLFPSANYGLVLANNAIDANNDIDIPVGQGVSDDYTTMISLASALTKRLDATWVAGNNEGMLDAGSKTASTLYAMFLIYNPTTAVVDVLASTSFTAPTMPSGFTKKYLLGAILTNAGNNIIAFEQAGSSYCNLKEYFTFVNDSTMTNDTYETVTIPAPPSSIAQIMANVSNPTSVNGQSILYIRPSIEPTSLGDAIGYMNINAGIETIDAGKSGTVFVPTTNQIKYACAEDSGSATVQIVLRGWEIKR